MIERTIRRVPKMDIEDIAKCVTGSSGRIQATIYKNKYPRAFGVKRLERAKAAILKHIQRNTVTTNELKELIRTLERSNPKSPLEAQDATHSIQAISSFLLTLESLNLAGLYMCEEPVAPKLLLVEGVAVSVRPDLLVRGYTKRGKPYVGTIKLRYSHLELSQEEADYQTVLLRRYLEQAEWAQHTRVSHKHCMLVDVFGQAVYRAPKHYLLRFSKIQKTCSEIATKWELVQ